MTIPVDQIKLKKKHILDKGSKRSTVHKKEMSNENLGHELIMACEKRNLDLVKSLVDQGADVNYVLIHKDKEYYDHWTPLKGAIWNPDISIIDYLISKGANVNEGFIFACQKGDLELTQKFIDVGANIEYVRAKDNMDALYYAVFNGDLNVIDFLISKGADINKIGDKPRLLLFTACEYLKPGVVASLIKHGVDVNAKKENGETALFNLQYGVPWEDLDTLAFDAIDQMVGAGIDLYARNSKGNTALYELFEDNLGTEFARAKKLATYYDKQTIIDTLAYYGQRLIDIWENRYW